MSEDARRYALGVDYGTNSCRALVVDVATGEELADSVFAYPSGREGILLDPSDPNLARQRPLDYLRSFTESVRQVLAKAGRAADFDPRQLVGIGVDTTGSTPIPVDRDGVALAERDEFGDHPAAQAWLWKDHTGTHEALEITDLARRMGRPYLARCGNVYSSEWFWSKILHCARSAPEVFDAAWSWVECCDFIPAWLTGNRSPGRMARSVCAAGHKAMYAESWGGLPDKEFLGALDPRLAELCERLYDRAVPSDHEAGRLVEPIAREVGLPAGLPVAVGAIDAHMGAVGSGVRPGRLVKVLGTSTCDMAVAPAEARLADIPGICGMVPGSIVPGLWGVEAGQSAVGDIFDWFVRRLAPAEFAGPDGHGRLSDAAAELQPGASGLLALDWNNGNRCVLVDARLTGLLLGQTVHTTAPEVYRALVEATGFGGRMILERLAEYGVGVDEVVTCGGIATRSELVLQLYADILNRPIKRSRSAQSCALGAALFGAVVGGAYDSVPEAQDRMTGTEDTEFRPRPEATTVYDELFGHYRTLHDAFGTQEYRGRLDHVMKNLIALRDRIRHRSP